MDVLRQKKPISKGEQIKYYQDFVNLNPFGIKTIRVHTGRFKNQKAKSGYDAIYHKNDLSYLNTVLGIF
mgnify:CR=1 FL=1